MLAKDKDTASLVSEEIRRKTTRKVISDSLVCCCMVIMNVQWANLIDLSCESEGKISKS